LEEAAFVIFFVSRYWLVSILTKIEGWFGIGTGVTDCCVFSAFPTLKFFINGFPTDYTGPRKADGLISYLRRLSSPYIETFGFEADLRKFVRTIGPEIPLFVGFGLKASDLEDLAKKYRTKAWFAVLGMFSDKIMMDFDFDKGPALVVMRGEYGERSTFYGPFEGRDSPVTFVSVQRVSINQLRLLHVTAHWRKLLPWLYQGYAQWDFSSVPYNFSLFVLRTIELSFNST
jgi:hypothetical protein